MNNTLYFMDSYTVDKLTCIREDCQTMYCNNKDTLNEMVSRAKSLDRRGITTGEAYFNANGVLVKKSKK